MTDRTHLRTHLTQLPERNLDILRAIAVSCVVADHFAWPYTSGALWEVGLFGVFLFFVHTSLVLMASLERMAQEEPSRCRLVWTFYVRRAFRIYPLAWAALAMVLLIRMPISVRAVPPATGLRFVAPTLRELVSNVALVQNVPGVDARSLLGVLWSLPVELQMYVLLPVLWWLARRADARIKVLATTAMACVLGLLYGAHWIEVPGLWRLPSVAYYAPCFMGGIIAYAMLRRRQLAEAGPTFPAWTWVIALALTALIYRVGHPVIGTPSEWRGWFACIALGAMIPFVSDLPESRITRGAHHIAKYSYGVYLLHTPAQWIGLVVLASAPAAVRWGVSAALIVVLPVIAYHAIEAPMIRVGRSVVRRRTRVESATAEQAPSVKAA